MKTRSVDIIDVLYTSIVVVDIGAREYNKHCRCGQVSVSCMTHRSAVVSTQLPCWATVFCYFIVAHFSQLMHCCNQQCITIVKIKFVEI